MYEGRTHAKTGLRPPQAREGPETRRESWSAFCPRTLRGVHSPADFSMSHFWPPEQWEGLFLCSKPPSSCRFVTAPQGNQHSEPMKHLAHHAPEGVQTGSLAVGPDLQVRRGSGGPFSEGSPPSPTPVDRKAQQKLASHRSLMVGHSSFNSLVHYYP